MRTISCLSIVALLIGSAVAQYAPVQHIVAQPAHIQHTAVHHAGSHYTAPIHGGHKKGEPLITVAEKNVPGTPPKPINESDRKKQCPVGFEFVGKQCAKTLTAPADTICPTGTTLVDGKCAKYVGKLSDCPAGYQASKGTCVRTLTSEAEIICPDGFTLSGKDSCVRKVAQPDRKICPAGSIARGDDCVTTALVPPEFSCPDGYVLEGRKCRREETFDCTPARSTAAPQKGAEIEDKHLFGGFRHEAPSKGKEGTRYTIHDAAPTVEEYVISETCKRIITEPARRICAPGGILDGKLCRIENKVEHIFKNGGFRDEFIPAIRRCPLGYAETGSKGECQATDETLPSLYCPGNTIDLGSRCAIYNHPRTVCPTGFTLEGKACLKTIFAAPIVEYTVTYSCTGKNCGENNHQHHQYVDGAHHHHH